ncbi:hypothetical protein GQ53DRAFT_801045 [Thozetella sp. PMI_491]|nr:hypothetical protein GQ53DRAFT_801045 [Thozetella sp. PMI_491]
MQKHFGRLVVQDSNQSRYVGSGFWSRVNDELDGLELGTWGLAAHDSDSSEDEGFAGIKLPDRTPLERHAFIFRHNLDIAAPDLRELRPLQSQIPFLLDVFADSVNYFSQVVHMPTITKMVRGSRVTEGSNLTPANEALMFSIYYAAVTSMEPEDVLKNFGATQSELNLKYRLGLELALAKADFLNNPDLVLVQAFIIFLCLLRRHESPRFVWMMAGVCIRMAQALGLHRDPSHFSHLTPYEAEMRRRAWWTLCTIDARASEDQGTDLTIVGGSFDTIFPLNINDADISPETTEMPAERQGTTDISLALVWFRICEISRKMMSPGPKEQPLSLEDQSRMLDSIYEGMERNYLQYTESGNIVSWVAANITRLVISKIALFIYLPVLFSTPGERFSVEIRNKLLIAAIEVAEYNHLLNAEEDCRQWRWIFQTYTHWHATVYLLIEIARRPWSPIIERAWVALHSSWLIPSQPNMDKNLRIWVPLRKLMANARRHREAELERLRGDPSALEAQELSDRNVPAPGSHGPFPAEESERLFREHWLSLFPSAQNPNSQVKGHLTAPYGHQDPWSTTISDPAFLPGLSTRVLDATSNEPAQAQTGAPASASYGTPSTAPASWLGGWTTGPGLTPWLWADTDPNVEVFNDMDVNMEAVEDVNWYNWLESVQTMESNSDRANDPGT